MRDIWDNPDVQEYLRRANKELRPMISGSAVTVALVAEEPDAKVAIELGFMMLFDKPIIVLAPPGRKIAEKLRKIADAVIIGEPGDPHAMEQLREAMTRLAGPLIEEPGTS